MNTMRLLAIPLAAYLITVVGCLAEPEVEDLDTTSDVSSTPQTLVIPPPCTEAMATTNCGGGGAPPPPPPPRPVYDTSASHLSVSARSYLTQAGVPNSGTVGATEWVNACRVSAHQGAGTFNSGITNSCSWANVRPGWIILEIAHDVLRNDNNRGSASVSSTNGPVTISVTEFGSRFNGAISLAVSAGGVSASRSLQLEYQRLNGYSFSFNGEGNNVVAVVRANGGLFKGSFIDVQTKAKLLRVY
jgi:hypothetical protein